MALEMEQPLPVDIAHFLTLHAGQRLLATQEPGHVVGTRGQMDRHALVPVRAVAFEVAVVLGAGTVHPAIMARLTA